MIKVQLIKKIESSFLILVMFSHRNISYDLMRAFILASQPDRDTIAFSMFAASQLRTCVYYAVSQYIFCPCLAGALPRFFLSRKTDTDRLCPVVWILFTGSSELSERVSICFEIKQYLSFAFSLCPLAPN